MSRRELKDLRIGLIFGVILFFLIVLPVLRFHNQIASEAKRSSEPFTLYIKEL